MNSSRSRYVPRRSHTVHCEILNDEVCIYNWTSQRVHALNATAARVWHLCDGTLNVAEIAERLRGDIGIHADEIVALAVAQLSEQGLLETQVPAGTLALSRRRLIRQIGVSAALLPVVSSIAAPSALEAQSAHSQVFNYTGASQTFVVPAAVSLITVEALGASSILPSTGVPIVGPGVGLGGKVLATIPVTAGETLILNVGGVGTVSYTLDASGTAGFNGGGQGGGKGGVGGGGASDVRRGSTKLVVAGGGGGMGNGPAIYISGGAGGGTTAAAGTSYSGAGGGGGGTQTAGGSGGGVTPGLSGASGVGGNGAPAGVTNFGGGGGGGGYFGGGGGGANGLPTFSNVSGGGGGGSSYADPSATNVTHGQGVQSGNGKVTITW